MPTTIEILSEAEALIAEARALQVEAAAHAMEIAGTTPGAAANPTAAADDPATSYARLQDAAFALVELAGVLQDPARKDPYAPLGAKIAPPAQKLLSEIKAFQLPSTEPGPQNAPTPGHSASAQSSPAPKS